MSTSPQSKFETSCQTVIAVLGDPPPAASPEFHDALLAMSRALTLLAIHFLTRLKVPDAEELAQDAVQRWHQRMLVRGFLRYRRHACGRRFAPYGIRALSNICVTILRERRHGGDSSASVVDVPDPRDNPPLAAERKEIRETLSQAMADLSLDVRAALTLTELHGLSSREAAAELGTSERIVNSRKFRGREQLRKRMFASGLVALD